MAETKLMCSTHGESGSSHPEMFGECWFKTYTRLIPKAYPEWERVENGECRMVERVLSAPGELVDPADLDYEAAMRPLDKFLHDDPWFPHERYRGELVALIVRAALGVGEPVEGNG